MLLRSSIREQCAKTGTPLTTSDLAFTYLSEQRFLGGIDNEVVPKAALTPENEQHFTRMPQLKEDVYVSTFLWRSWTLLVERIRLEQPDVIVASGKWTLFFLGCYTKSQAPLGRLTSVKSSAKSPNTFGLNVKFRGSTLALYEEVGLPKPCIIFPIIPHAYQSMINAPTAIRADYLRLAMFYANFKNGFAKPEDFLTFEPKVTVYREFEAAKKFLENLLNKLQVEPLKLSVDLEVTARTIDTVGICYDSEEGHSIPLYERFNYKVHSIEAQAFNEQGKATTVALGSTLSSFRSVFSLDEEAELVYLICTCFSHPNAKHIGQNYHYDCIIMKETWGLRVDPWRCTMTLASVLHNTRKKGLAFLCSLYNQHYVYWKDDLNAKDSFVRWEYCAKDALNTYLLAESLEDELQTLLERNKRYYLNLQERTAKNVLTRMLSGLVVDLETRLAIDTEFTKLYNITEAAIRELVGYELNIYSTPQIRDLMVSCLGIDPILDRKSKNPTFGRAAMAKYVTRYPEYAFLLSLIAEAKGIHTYLSTFIRAKLDEENTLRSFIGVAGTKSFRFSSKKWVDGKGANIMNWSSGDRTSLAYSTALAEQYAQEDEFSPEEDYDSEDIELSPPTENVLKLEVPNSKRIVIPGHKDLFFVNVDLASGDLHFVAWMAGAKWVMDVLSSGGDVYTELAKIYYKDGSIKKKDPRRQKFKAVCHACVTGTHEVLTKQGWLNIEDLEDGVEIAVWDRDSQAIWFEVPAAINRDFVEASEDLYHIEGAAFSFLGTQDHKFPATTDLRKNIKKYEASKLPKSAKIPYNGFYEGGAIHINEDLVRLIVALQADGHVKHVSTSGDETIEFRFVKQRKIDRLERLLTSLEIPYNKEVRDYSSVGNPVTSIRFTQIGLAKNKYLDWSILTWSKENLQTFLDELQYWDGHIRTSNGVRTSISTTNKEAAYIIQTVAHLCGKASKVSVIEAKAARKTLYEVSVNNREFHNMSSTYSRGTIKHGGTKVYCPQTSTGYFVYRYKGNIAISSNTNYLGMPKTIALQAGLAEEDVLRIQDFYFTMNPEIVSNYQNKILTDCLTKGYTENYFGARYHCDTTDEKKDKTWRQKMVSLPAQGSVADLINEIMDRADDAERIRRLEGKYYLQSKLQCHDAGLWVGHSKDKDWKDRLDSYFNYEMTFFSKDGTRYPLTIPWEMGVSNKSYADCK